MIREFGIEIKGFDPVLAYEVMGQSEGPCLVVISGVHGAEYVGPRATMDFVEKIKNKGFDLKGRLLIIPVLNESGFYGGFKQVIAEDGLNLNRIFPASGDSKAHLLAKMVEEKLYPEADFLLDFHGGDINEEMEPLVFFPAYAEGNQKKMIDKVIGNLSTTYLVPSQAKNGLYSYANSLGIPSLLLERGGMGLWTYREANFVILNIFQTMKALGMISLDVKSGSPKMIKDPVYLSSPSRGVWYPHFKAGEFFKKGDELGILKDLRGNIIEKFEAAYDGVLLYQNIGLGVSEGDHLIAYGKIS